MKTDPDEVVLVPRTAWFLESAERGYHKIDKQTGFRMLRNLDEYRMLAVRNFAHQLGRFDIHRMRDWEVLDLIRNAIDDGGAVVVQKGSGKAEPLGATAELRRLVARVQKATRHKLSYRGRSYRLVVDVDMARLPGRDYYEVASQAEARTVLDGIAQESPTAAEPLRNASEKLSKDWHPPLQADGLVLLRRIPVTASAPKDNGPAITPSQMKALSQKDWIEIEVVDQDGEPYPMHYRLEPAGSDVREGQLDEAGCVNVSEVESGTCKLTLGAAY